LQRHPHLASEARILALAPVESRLRRPHRGRRQRDVARHRKRRKKRLLRLASQLARLSPAHLQGAALEPDNDRLPAGGAKRAIPPCAEGVGRGTGGAGGWASPLLPRQRSLPRHHLRRPPKRERLMGPPPMLHRAIFEPQLPASEPHVGGAAKGFEES